LRKTNFKTIILGMLAFVFVSFLVQALSHFVINKEHFAAIDFMRKEPIMAFGVTTMFIQGIILTYIYLLISKKGNSIAFGLKYGLLMGAFLVSYIALVEPSKYAAPSITSWILVEGISGLVQFSLFGLLLGIISKKQD